MATGEDSPRTALRPGITNSPSLSSGASPGGGGSGAREPEPSRRPRPSPAAPRPGARGERESPSRGRAAKMAEAPASPAPLSPLEVELDPEFEPQSRPRSCTWPLQRPELQASPAKPSGETAADSMIPEEEDDEDDEDGGGRAGSAMAIGGGGSGTLGSGLLLEDSARVLAPGGQDPGSGPATAAGALSGGTQALLQPQQPLPPPQPGAAGGSGQPRKCSSRRNAWGNLSYADLITRAIESSPDKRLTLSQIYEWMVRCVPYFKDKGDSNSSAGWKVRTHPGLAARPAGPSAQRETRLGFVGARLRAPGQGVGRGSLHCEALGVLFDSCGRGTWGRPGGGKEAPQRPRAWPGEERGQGTPAREGRTDGSTFAGFSGQRREGRSAANFGVEFTVVGVWCGRCRWSERCV